MKIVLDSSVAVKWVLPEVDSDKAESLRDAYRQNVYELVSPDVLPIEVGHALTRAERQLRINIGDAEDLWNEVMADAPQLVAYLPLMPRAIQISSTHRIGVYDCLYVALAEQEGCRLVTEDARLSGLKTEFPFITSLVDLP